MRISTSKALPATKQLIEILKEDLPDNYTYKLFGLGENKTILVTESSSVAAQVSIRHNEITIQGTPPPPLAYFISFLGWTELGFLLIYFVNFSTKSKLHRLEKEIAHFLKTKYN